MTANNLTVVPFNYGLWCVVFGLVIKFVRELRPAYMQYQGHRHRLKEARNTHYLSELGKDAEHRRRREEALVGHYLSERAKDAQHIRDLHRDATQRAQTETPREPDYEITTLSHRADAGATPTPGFRVSTSGAKPNEYDNDKCPKKSE